MERAVVCVVKIVLKTIDDYFSGVLRIQMISYIRRADMAAAPLPGLQPAVHQVFSNSQQLSVRLRMLLVNRSQSKKVLFAGYDVEQLWPFVKAAAPERSGKAFGSRIVWPAKRDG